MFAKAETQHIAPNVIEVRVSSRVLPHVLQHITKWVIRQRRRRVEPHAKATLGRNPHKVGGLAIGAGEAVKVVTSPDLAGGNEEGSVVRVVLNGAEMGNPIVVINDRSEDARSAGELRNGVIKVAHGGQRGHSREARWDGTGRSCHHRWYDR